MEKRKWYIRKSSRGGYYYLWYCYSIGRNVRVVHNPLRPDYYNVEIDFAGDPLRLVNFDTYTEDFNSIEAAFHAANEMIADWVNSEKEDNPPTNRMFKKFAEKYLLDYWNSK